MLLLGVGWSFLLSWCSLVSNVPKLAYSKKYSLSFVQGRGCWGDGMMAGNTFFWKAFSQPKALYLLGWYGPVRTTRSYSGICCGSTNRWWNCSLLFSDVICSLCCRHYGGNYWERKKNKTRAGRKRGKTTDLCLEARLNSLLLVAIVFFERRFCHKHTQAPQQTSRRKVSLIWGCLSVNAWDTCRRPFCWCEESTREDHSDVGSSPEKVGQQLHNVQDFSAVPSLSSLPFYSPGVQAGLELRDLLAFARVLGWKPWWCSTTATCHEAFLEVGF